GLLAARTYTYAVEAVDKAGNRSRSNPVTLVTGPLPDTVPPTKPTALAAADILHDRLTLSWLPGTDENGIAGYELNVSGAVTTVTDAVYGGHDGTLLTYPITGLTPETTYTFELKAIDTAGNRSESSDVITAETLAAPPGGLRVTD